MIYDQQTKIFRTTSKFADRKIDIY